MASVASTPGTAPTAGGAQAPKGTTLATTEQMDAVRRLVQIVARLFYNDGHVLVVDQLVSVAVIPSDVLARRLGLQARDAAALAAKLVEDRVVCIFRTNETRDVPGARPVSRSYYYLDYKQFLDVVKWRMMAMRRHIDTRLRRGLDNKGYLCPRCRKSFSALEVSHLLDFSRNVFVCDVPGCGTELIDNEEAEDVRQSKDTLTRFNEQLSVVQQALRGIEGVALPPLDVRAWLAKHAADQPWATELPKEEQGAKPAAPQPPAAPEARLRVEVAGVEAGAELESAARSREEEQRAQNILPAWHVASTVSGEATGLANGEGAQEGAEGGVAAEGPVAEADEDYYARYASQLQAEAEPEAEEAGKRAPSDGVPAEVGTERDAKRQRTEPAAEAGDAGEDELMEEMEDVI